MSVCISQAPQSNWQDPVPSRLGVNSRPNSDQAGKPRRLVEIMCRFPSTAREQLKHRTNCRQSWEHSARCVKPAKSEIHATATVNDERGKLCRQLSETQREVHQNQQNQKKTHAEHGSVVEPSIARPPVVAPTGTATLSKNLTNPKTASAEAPQFSAQPNQSTCRCTATGASTTIPRTVTVRSPRSAVQCARCVPRSACNWKVHHSVEELN